FSPAAEDVFSESLPTPPVKVVRGGQLQRDVADLWVRRSRVPMLVGLDLRAKIGANNVGAERLHALIGQYGADTVKAVMKRMMSDAESRLRDKLSALPDGSWSATGYQDQSHEGDRNLHKITVTTTKTGDHLTFDFTGTDPQAGVINCTYAGMRGGVMLALLPILAGDIPWSAGGLMRCFDLVTEEGTLNNATFPAAVGRGPIGPAWLTGSLVAECLSRMLDRDLELGKNVQATCCGTWDTAVIAGLDERGDVPAPFLNIIMEPMAGGYGARPDADGIDTGGLFCIPMGRVPDVEMTEFLYPVLALWRREVPDSGGPGRHRGGLGASIALTPHGTSLPMGLVLASAGKAVAQNGGLAGGHPGNSGLDVVARRSRVADLFAAGRLPSTLDEVSDTLEPGQNYASSYLAPGEVFAMTWQGGGGYGDPLTRDPDAVARDLREDKITAAAATGVYGVVLDGGAVDRAATAAERDRRRDHRRARSAAAPSLGKTSLAAARRLDDNLVEPSGGGLACGHCGELLRTADGEPAVAVYEGPATEAGPQIIATATDYVDAPVVFRQYCCPSCWTAVYSGVVPAGHPDALAALGHRTTAPAG
ncbi:hydantoinase B/oxoprolinase family protein, partial [Amycolatopsis lexingtonensis]